jgi:hypothetical protein
MASISGTYRDTHIASLATMETLINSHFTAENARMIVLGGAATVITGSLTISMLTDNGAGTTYSHKVTFGIHCASLADTVTLVAAIEVYLTAVLAESTFNVLQEIDVSMNTSMSN